MYIYYKLYKSILICSVVVRMQEFTVFGVEQKGMTPRLITSKQITPGISLLDVFFESNPLGNYSMSHNLTWLDVDNVRCLCHYYFFLAFILLSIDI